MLHEMYTYDGNIDSLVVGGSEVFKAYDAKKSFDTHETKCV